MTHQSHIETIPPRDALIREKQKAVIARIAADPGKARSTIRTTGTVGEGLTCEVTQGKFAAVMDMSAGMGGDCTGPAPGFFARAAVAGCVGIAVKMLAAREGVPFVRVDVAVETDFDDAALFGIGPGSAAPTETRVSVEIVTDAERAVIDDIVARALAMDPWFLALREPQRVATSVSVSAPKR